MTIETFFSPRGVAIVGASADPTKLGYGVARNLIQSQYKGAIHLVNPKGGTLMSLPMRASLAMDRARAIGQNSSLCPVPPLRAGLAAHASGPRGARYRPARSNPPRQEHPAVRGEAGISMGHRGLLLRLRFPHQQPRIGALCPSIT